MNTYMGGKWNLSWSSRTLAEAVAGPVQAMEEFSWIVWLLMKMKQIVNATHAIQALTVHCKC